MALMWGSRRDVYSELLSELRALRSEIRTLADRVGQSATRDDLDDYVTRDVFNAHLEEQKRRMQDWHFWLPYVVSALSLLLWFMEANGIHLVGR
jgi:hypothetical protein